MTIELPITVLCIIHTLESHGYSCEIVGGAVRDSLLGVNTSDWDFTTNATPEQILPLFAESFYENQFGTVMVAQKHLNEQFHIDVDTEGLSPDLVYDITTYRSDGEYRNHRKPETVVWGKSIEEDLQRRDFTINAIALRLHTKDLAHDIQQQNHQSSDRYAVSVFSIDPFYGEEDMRRKLIRTVGNPDERFSEDALRILRAVRFANQFQFAIESETLTALESHVKDLSLISMERISSEFMKMISSPTPDVAVVLLDKLGILPFIIPELETAKGVRQSGHHIYDVWEHSLRALGSCASNDPVVRLATLLHDIGKPSTYQETPMTS
jgi:tRNA nucleotidyltransferase/poly(A) polymerase